MNAKYLYTYVDELLISYVLDCRETRKTSNSHDF